MPVSLALSCSFWLTSLNHGRNICPFRYRNHGADHGQVLVGMQVPPRDQKKFQAFLDKAEYP